MTDLREVSDGDLWDELRRRKTARREQVCDYCNKPFSAPTCRFPDRHVAGRPPTYVWPEVPDEMTGVPFRCRGQTVTREHVLGVLNALRKESPHVATVIRVRFMVSNIDHDRWRLWNQPRLYDVVYRCIRLLRTYNLVQMGKNGHYYAVRIKVEEEA